MHDIRCEKHDGVQSVLMARGKVNALNLPMVEELIAAIEEGARDDTILGVVLGSDCPGFFSCGFDVKEVFRYDRETMILFFSRFIDLYESLYLLPKPTVAAVSGHAFAGGAILSLACDCRILAQGDFGFALNEVNLGLLTPPGVIRMAIGAAGFNHARAILLGGEPVGPTRALEIGLAHSLAEAGAVLKEALTLCAALAQKPAAAFAAIKLSFRELAGHSAFGEDKRILSDFVEYWFSPEAELRKQTLLDSLRSPSNDG
jgi:enoyl-CoA hydratase